MSLFLAACCLGLAARLAAFTEHDHDHSLPNLDRRFDTPPADPTLTPAKAAAANKLAGQIPGLRVEPNPLTRSAKHVASTTGFLTGPSGEGPAISAAAAGAVPPGDQHRAVKTFLASHAPLFGHGPELIERARLRREFVGRNNGLRTVVWEQELDDIPVYQGVMVGHITARGELAGLSSQFIADASRAADLGTPGRARLQAAPAISSAEAVRLASEAVEDPVEARAILAHSPQPAGRELRQLFNAGALPGETEARLTWLPLDDSRLRLCWEIELTRRLRGERYRVLIDVATGEVMIRQRLTLYLMPATYNVFTSDSPSPFTPSWQTPSTNQPPRVGRQRVTIDALNPVASPLGWIADGENETRGNNVAAHTDRNGDDLPDLPRPQGSPFRVFDPPLDFSVEPAEQGAAAVVQLFYWCNWMHDRLYELGFDEASGNFQKDNFGRGGLGNDAIIADAQDGSGFNNANFTPTPDGVPGRIQMFLWSAPTPDADGDFDAEVVLHEYAHGLSTRLVGGGMGLDALQSAGLGEGWSDFYALALLSDPGDDLDAAYAYGGYVTYLLAGFVENYYFGIRRYPYSTDMTKNPLTYRDIDPVQISEHVGVPHSPLFPFSPIFANEVHAQGEVWCAMLWEARANLIRKHGFTAGNRLILQTVTDGMKLTPPNPTFLQARDAILLADQVNNAGANYTDLWAAFAKRGLGFSATSPGANTTAGVTEAFDLPDALYLINPGPFAASGPAGNVGPLCQAYPITNISSQPITWSAHVTERWIEASPASGTLPPGASAVINICLTPEAQALARGAHPGAIQFSNHVSGVFQIRPAEIRVLEFASMPFAENFEGAELASHWSITGTGGYQTQLTPRYEPRAGLGHVTLDSSGNGKARNELTLGLDLGGYTNVVLRFWAKTFGDEADGPPLRPFVAGADFDGVAISADGIRWFEVQSLRGLTGIYREFTVDLDAAIAAAGLRFGATFQIRFNQVDDFQIPFDGIALDDISVNGRAATRLFVSAPAAAREGDGLLAEPGVLRLGEPTPQTLTVSLSANEPSKLDLPRSVTIPAGSDRAEFPIRVLDDKTLDGSVPVTLRAEAPGYFSGQSTIVIADNEKAVLRVTLPPRLREGAARQRHGVVRVQPKPKRDVTVQLTTSDAGELEVPATVIIPAGANQTRFEIAAVDDNRIDGPQPVTVTASVENWVTGRDTILVLDNERPAFSVLLPAAFGEGEGSVTNAGAVRLWGTLRTNLVVRLASGDDGELTVPAMVEVPAGELEARFTPTVVNDAIADGSQTVRVSGSAAGFMGTPTSAVILDDETPPMPARPEPADGETEVAINLNLRWSTGLGEILVNGGFETGDFSGWQLTNSGYGAWTINDGTLNPDGPEETNAPYRGRFDAGIAQIGGGTHLLQQEIRIPDEALGATLSWADRIRNHTPYFAPNHLFRVEIRDTNNAVLAVAFQTQPGDPPLNNWTTRQFSMDQFRGRTVRVAFYQEDSTGYFNTYLDAVSVRLSGPDAPTTYDVYLGTTTNLGPAEHLGNTTNAIWPATSLALDSTYYWRVIARRGDAASAGPVWRFTTRGLGGLHHFDWARIASPQFAGQRFPVTITARDDLGNTVRDFNDNVALTALAGSGNGSSVVITELDLGNGDRVEFQNVSGLPVDLSGWSMSVYDSVSWPAPTATIPIAAGTVCSPRGVFTLSDNGTAHGRFPEFFTGTNVNWSFAALGNPVAVLLRDAGGDIVDFVCAGTADPALITAPRKIPAGEWNGLPVSALVSAATHTLLRFGTSDGNDAVGWTNGPPSFAAANSGLTLPFATRQFVEVAPAVVSNFVTGVWSGFITVIDPAPRVTLQASDGAGHAGRANEIGVLAPDDLSVSFIESPGVVLIGDSSSYRLVVTNPGPARATGLLLTNTLPEGFSFLSYATFNGACSNAGGQVVCALDNLSAGDSARLTINVRAMTMGRWTNRVAISRAEPEPRAGNNVAEAISLITGPWIAVTNITITEGSTTAARMRVPVRLSAPGILPVSVAFATSNGTATAVTDYAATNGVLRFEPGVTNLVVEIPIVPDRVDESLETFFVNLFDATNGVIAVAQGRQRITDDDLTPMLTVADASVREGPAGSTNFIEFQLRLSGASGIDVGVSYSTRDVTATAPADYQTIFGRLTFPAGETNQTLRVPVIGDNRFEPRESFELLFNNLVAVNVSATPPRGFIDDDDDRVLDHFAWGEVPSPQYAGRPFFASLTARDGLDRLVPDFQGSVRVAGVADARDAAAGTATNGWEFPLGTLYHDGRAQVIYLPEELRGRGLLNGLSLSVAAPPGQPLRRWTIRMKHTALRDYTVAAWETSGWTTVHQTDAEITTPGTATFLFDTPFNYDGSNALMVDFSFDNPTYTDNGLCRSTVTPRSRALVFQTDSAFGDPLDWAAGIAPAPVPAARIPNATFHFETPVSVAPVPVVELTNGVWSGALTADEPWASLFLRANDGLGRIANSRPFRVDSAADTDGDGLPDAWEREFLGDTSRRAGDDVDGDGVDNRSEFRAGTNPGDATSAAVIRAALVRGADVMVRFGSVAGRAYRLERATRLEGADWTPIGGLVPGTGGVMEVIDSGAAAAAPGFYRLRVLP